MTQEEKAALILGDSEPGKRDDYLGWWRMEWRDGLKRLVLSIQPEDREYTDWSYIWICEKTPRGEMAKFLPAEAGELKRRLEWLKRK